MFKGDVDIGPDHGYRSASAAAIWRSLPPWLTPRCGLGTRPSCWSVAGGRLLRAVPPAAVPHETGVGSVGPHVGAAGGGRRPRAAALGVPLGVRPRPRSLAPRRQHGVPRRGRDDGPECGADAAGHQLPAPGGSERAEAGAGARARHGGGARRIGPDRDGRLLRPSACPAERAALTRRAASASVLFLLFPLSFAYAILRHRLLDIGLIIRQGLQYALARRVVVSLVPACALLLVIDLVVHGDQPLRNVLQSRGWIYAAVAGLALAAHARSSAGSPPSTGTSSGSATMRSGSCAKWWRKLAGRPAWTARRRRS